MHDEDFHNWFNLLELRRINKSMKTRWASHVM
jgi:hypothetical protein